MVSLQLGLGPGSVVVESSTGSGSLKFDLSTHLDHSVGKKFVPSYEQVLKEQKKAGPSNTPYIILKYDVVLLNHEAYVE